MALTPIRPQTTPSTTAPQRPADAARTAAQRAFFQAALGGEVQAAPQPRPVEPVQAVPRSGAGGHTLRRPLTDEPPARVMRPGSFIDIKV